MHTPDQAEIDHALRELLEHPKPPEWLMRMIEHYRKTGAFRPEGLRRLLGDPSKGVVVEPNASVDAILATVRRDYISVRKSAVRA
jgi:hypothetical protein